MWVDLKTRPRKISTRLAPLRSSLSSTAAWHMITTCSISLFLYNINEQGTWRSDLSVWSDIIRMSGVRNSEQMSPEGGVWTLNTTWRRWSHVLVSGRLLNTDWSSSTDSDVFLTKTKSQKLSLTTTI